MMVQLEKLIAKLEEAEHEEMESATRYRERAKKQKDPEVAKILEDNARIHSAMATALYEAQVFANESVE